MARIFGAAVFMMSRGDMFALMAKISGAILSGMARIGSAMIADRYQADRNHGGWRCQEQLFAAS